jgi:hypothetical protein
VLPSAPKPANEKLSWSRSTREGTSSLCDLHPQILPPSGATRAGFCLRAGYGDGGFSGATTDRPALQRLLADITAGRASAIRSAASSPTSSPTVRYWNRARQRYDRLSARYSCARVSLPTQAARPGPDNRGKPRLLDRERRVPARDRFAPDSPLEGDGFELLVPLQPGRVPPAARSKRARLRAIALGLSSTWVSPLAMLAERRRTSRMRKARRPYSVAGYRVACRAPRLSSTIGGGSAQLALLRSGSLVSQPSALGGRCRQCLGLRLFRGAFRICA